MGRLQRRSYCVDVGITGDGELDNGEYSDYTCTVTCVVDWYGPADIPMMGYYDSMMDHTLPTSPEGLLIGGFNVLENIELAEKASPISYLTEDKDVPPILMMHGSRDFLVPFNQSVRLYEKLRELGKDVEMYKVEDGSHGSGGFAGDGAIELVLGYIERQFSK